MRTVMTRVFPEPAPARMSSGPSVAFTASTCCGFSEDKISIGSFDERLNFLKHAMFRVAHHFEQRHFDAGLDDAASKHLRKADMLILFRSRRYAIGEQV